MTDLQKQAIRDAIKDLQELAKGQEKRSPACRRAHNLESARRNKAIMTFPKRKNDDGSKKTDEAMDDEFNKKTNSDGSTGGIAYPRGTRLSCDPATGLPKEKQPIKKPIKSGLGMIYIRSTLFGEDGNFPDLGACASRVAQATLFSHESRHLAFGNGRDGCDSLDLHHKIYCEDIQIAADLAADIKARNGCEPGFDEWLNNRALPELKKQKDKLLCLFEICKGAK